MRNYNLKKKYMKNILFITLIVFLFSCKDEKKPLTPITTANASEITWTTAVSGGNVIDSGGRVIVSRGICWNTSNNPTISNSKTIEGGSIGPFISMLTQLTPNTSYYIRAYATDNTGTGYGNQVTFTTKQLDSWTELPYFALPLTGVSLMVGQNVTIYGDALI